MGRVPRRRRGGRGADYRPRGSAHPAPDGIGSMDEARRLSDESARFNIGPFLRNINVPTTALFFFRPENLRRFKLTRKSVGRDGTWEIAFRETERPTLIRTPEGGSGPSEGSVWANCADGTLARTRFRITPICSSANT